MLTDSLRRTLLFIRDYIDDHGYSPKLPEIAEGIGIKSTGVVHRYIHELANAGYLEVQSRRHRGIRLLTVDDGVDDDSTTETGIPLWGKIAAGRPIEAIAEQQTIELSCVFTGKNIYALKVQGDSMIEAGILDGDFVICEPCANADNGEIVVALIDREEATLKHLQKNNDGTVTLIPANQNYSLMTYDAKRVMVQGIVIGQFRDYSV